MNRSYSTACTPTSAAHTPKSSKRKKKKLTNLKLSLSGGRLALATASPSNLSDLILGSENKTLLDQDTNSEYLNTTSKQQNEQNSNLDQLSNLNTKSLSQKRKLYGRSATAYSYYKNPLSENRSLSIEDAEDLAQSLIDKPITLEERIINNQFLNQQYTESFKTDHLQTTDSLLEYRSRTSSSGSHQLATNFNNRKARHQQPFSRQLSTGGLLTSNYSAKLGSSPTSSSQLLNQLAAVRSLHSSKQPIQSSLSNKKAFISQSTTDTHNLIDNDELIKDFIAPKANLKQQQQDIESKVLSKSGDSTESTNQSAKRSSSKNLKQQKSGGTDESDSIELRNMDSTKQKLIQTTSSGYETTSSTNKNSVQPPSSPNRINRPTTFTLNMPQSPPCSPKESTTLMRQFSDRDEISLYGTPKEGKFVIFVIFLFIFYLDNIFF